MTPDPHPWAQDLSSLHAQVWTRLMRGVQDRRAPARHPTLATVTPDGRPDARTVVLRAVDQGAASLDIHTDTHSAKVAHLRASPFAALHVWDSGAHLQIRLDCAATILTGPEAAELWARVPEASRLAYGSDPAPGQPVAHALAYRQHPDPARFAVLRLQARTLDVLHLGPQHCRARYDRADGWAGQWVAP